MAQEVRFLLIGAGNVGRRFLELLVRKGDVLRERLGLVLVPVGVADTSGAAICPTGLEAAQLVELKQRGQGVAAYPGWGQPGVTPLEMVRNTAADLLLEASPANLQDGQPGLACIEAALAAGRHVVTANKAPLVLAFPRLVSLARQNGVRLRFDATVAGGLPAVNLGQRDLAAADIQRFEGIVNLTTNYILTRMAAENLSYDQALAEAQAAGHAEANPRLDVEGWDAANKLVILANSVLGQPATLDDVEVEGILGVTPQMLAQATAAGQRIKLLAVAEQAVAGDGQRSVAGDGQRGGAGYRLRVGPVWLDADHPLARLGPKQMAVVFYTDICGVISAAIVEETPVPTAAAMLRDVVDIFAAEVWS